MGAINMTDYKEYKEVDIPEEETKEEPKSE